MKYTLNTYGWSSEFVGKSLTKEQTEQIENLKKARGVENLWEIRFDIDDEMDLDDVDNINNTDEVDNYDDKVDYDIEYNEDGSEKERKDIDIDNEEMGRVYDAEDSDNEDGDQDYGNLAVDDGDYD